MIYLIGGNGGGNYGDELIFHSLLSQLRLRLPKTELILDCNSVEQPEVLHNAEKTLFRSVRGFKSFSSSTLRRRFPRKKGKENSSGFLSAVQYGLEFFKSGEYRKQPQLEECLNLISEVDLLHIFGGGYINTLHPYSGFLLGFAAALRVEFDLPIHTTGLGITPLALHPESDLSPLRKAISQFSLFECRDSYSYDKLLEICVESENLINGLDDAFLLQPPKSQSDGKKRLHVCLNRTIVNKQYLNPERFREISAEFDEVLFWNCTQRTNNENHSWLMDTHPTFRLVNTPELLSKPIPVSDLDYMITEKFHPHLVAARLGLRGYYLSQTKYYDNKHRSLKHLGSTFVHWKDGHTDTSRLQKQKPDLPNRDNALMAHKNLVMDRIYATLG